MAMGARADGDRIPEPAAAHYEAGVRALAAGQFVQARQALTRSVELAPEFAGAWLDLALAAYGAGDVPAAEEFLDIVEARFSLPPRLSEVVSQLRQRIRAADGAVPRDGVADAWRWRGQVAVGVGHDTNANAGLDITELALTFPDGKVLLPLDPGYQPRGDRQLISGASLQGVRRVSDGELEWWGTAKGRSNLHVDGFDTLEVQAGLGWTRPAEAGGAPAWLGGASRLAVQLHHVRLGGQSLLNSATASAQQAWPRWPCRPVASLELERRQFVTAPNLDSQLVWLGGRASCPGLGGGNGGGLVAQLRLGQESARRSAADSLGRPGGDTRHQELVIGHQWAWGPPAAPRKFDIQAQWLHASDTEGYSPLLENNVARKMLRQTLAVGYSVPLSQGVVPGGGGWVATFNWQMYRQRSNLGLFESRGRQVQVGLQWGW